MHARKDRPYWAAACCWRCGWFIWVSKIVRVSRRPVVLPSCNTRARALARWNSIVSARGRNIHQGPYDDFIQTDAAINQGNSGGPLFDMDGNVIGMNTAIYSRSGGSVGIGFSIPSKMVKKIVAQLRDVGHPVRGWLGVRIQQVTPDIAESLGLKEPTGAMIAAYAGFGVRGGLLGALLASIGSRASLLARTAFALGCGALLVAVAKCGGAQDVERIACSDI